MANHNWITVCTTSQSKFKEMTRDELGQSTGKSKLGDWWKKCDKVSPPFL